MRDLEQIREQEDRSEGRPLALVGLLIAVTIGLVFAMGSLVGWTDEAETAEEDPLARLDRASGLQAADESEIEPEMPEVERSGLSFPEALGPADERPEVAATLAAAAAELAHPDPIARPAALPSLPAALPAAVAAGASSSAIARAAAHDPLVATSLPAPTTEPARAGHDGEYTVQVISYDSPEGAESFAAGLRARGHRAFVMRADVDGRGTVFRVRVGPFENLRQAQAYRREFERTERMNTLVVRRRDSA
ncbi:MAG: SPOR domain-containing protein [Sandaracinaceae bacterium]